MPKKKKPRPATVPVERPNLGTVVVNEEICYISKIELRDSRILFFAESQEVKTLPPQWVEDFVVHAPDGTVVLVAKVPTLVSARQEGHLVTCLPVQLVGNTDEPSRPLRPMPS